MSSNHAPSVLHRLLVLIGWRPSPDARKIGQLRFVELVVLVVLIIVIAAVVSKLL